MPPLPQRVNSIATSVRAAIAIASWPAPDSRSKRGRPAKARLEAQGKVIDLLKASGGKLSKNSVRKLGKMVKARRSTAHNALLGLIASGVVAKVGGALVLSA